MRGISNYFMFNNSYGQDKTSGLNSSINLADLASIKNGTYKKLLKAQYANQKKAASSDDSDKKNTTKSQLSIDSRKNIKSSVDDFQKTVSNLNNDDLWRRTNGAYDTEKITQAVKAFADGYNKVITQTEGNTSKEVSRSAGWMNSLTDTMKSSLARVGVNIGEDNRLTLDEDTFKKADMKSVKAMFSGTYSYATQASLKAGSIASAALRENSMYNSSGTYANMINSWFNTSI